MTQPATAALLARLEALEATHARAARRSRRWRGACLAALLACGPGDGGTGVRHTSGNAKSTPPICELANMAQPT